MDGPMPKRPRARQFLLPDGKIMAAKRRMLPTFPPQDTRQLLAEARSIADSERIAFDDAVKRAHRALKAKQVEGLTRVMGFEPESPTFWRDAFMRLAELHHNVGQLVHHWTPVDKSQKPYLVKLWEQISFVERVEAMSDLYGKRMTFRILAKTKRIDGEWQIDFKSRNSKADSAKAAALRQAYYRAKRRIASVRQFAASIPPTASETRAKFGLLSLSAFETALFDIGLSGDI
jgi:hypothetical protein